MNSEVIFLLLKMVGALLVITGCVGIGFYKCTEIAGRIEELKEIYRLILMIKSEIDYLAWPLAEAMGKAAGCCKERFRLFFEMIERRLYEKNGETFSEIWADSVYGCFSDSYMKDADLRLLCNIGEHLGLTDKQTQVSALELYMENLKATISHLESTSAQKQRVYKCISAFSGLMAVILLI